MNRIAGMATPMVRWSFGIRLFVLVCVLFGPGCTDEESRGDSGAGGPDASSLLLDASGGDASSFDASSLDGATEADAGLPGCVELGCETRHERCEEGPPAQCAGCVDGYRQTESGCVRISCKDLDCATELRVCVETSTSGARCGDCLSDLIETDARECRFTTAADGDLPCETPAGARRLDPVASRLARDAVTGTTALTVRDAQGFQRGDEIMIIDLQGPASGTWELARVEAVAATRIALRVALARDYSAAEVTMVQKIPNFRAVEVCAGESLTTDRFDGDRESGILAFRAERLRLRSGATMHADAAGLPGGINGALGRGYQAASHLGVAPARTSTANAGGGGAGDSGGANRPSCGGTCLQIASASGGGGYGTPGTAGSDGAGGILGGAGGGAYGDAALNALHLGSGGGGPGDGYENTNMCGPPGYSSEGYHRAAGGGGIVFIRAHAIDIEAGARLSASGAPGGSGFKGACWDVAPTGGGSGGSLYIRTATLTASPGTLRAQGGAGAIDQFGQLMSGDGGDGRVRIDYGQINGVAFPASSEASAVSVPAPEFTSAWR